MLVSSRYTSPATLEPYAEVQPSDRKRLPKKDKRKHADLGCALLLRSCEKNCSFIAENSTANETFTEIIELINDSIDYYRELAPFNGLLGESVIFTFIHAVLMPLAYGILLDFLSGNIPACMIQLRAILEALVKCYYADTLAPETWRAAFFADKISALERILRQEKYKLESRKELKYSHKRL